VTVGTNGTLRMIFSGDRSGAPLPRTGPANAGSTPAVSFQPNDAANDRSVLT